MEKADAGGKGVVVLATVKGDVHDIGKNLVDIILTNNGYMVYNLGIKIAITEMIDKALEVNADAIGMSGLLVKSTIIMRENLEELNTRGLAERVPVLLGGAALTRNYVERDLREVYDGRVFYGKDAFEGLRTMETLMAGKKSGELDPAFGREAGGRQLRPRKSATRRTGSGSGAPTSRSCADFHTASSVRGSQGIPRDEIGYSTRLLCPQPVAVPAPRRAAGKSDEEFGRAFARPCAKQLGMAKQESPLVPAAGGYRGQPE
jgi:5-methyltetrahydrofolate--homocysteine methyltransferase